MKSLPVSGAPLSALGFGLRFFFLGFGFSSGNRAASAANGLSGSGLRDAGALREGPRPPPEACRPAGPCRPCHPHSGAGHRPDCGHAPGDLPAAPAPHSAIARRRRFPCPSLPGQDQSLSARQASHRPDRTQPKPGQSRWGRHSSRLPCGAWQFPSPGALARSARTALLPKRR